MILVTGGTGNIGSGVVKGLIELGAPVRVLTRDAGKAAHLAGQAEVVEGDLGQPETLPAVMQGVDRLFLVTLENDTEQDRFAVEAAQAAGVKHIVKLSTLSADYGIAVGEWSLAHEQLIKDSGIAWTFLRPGQFSSNTLRWADSIKSQGKVYFPSTEQGKAAPIASRDISEVAVLALTQPGHEGKIYPMTGPALLTVAEQVQTLAEVLGRPIEYVNIPMSAYADNIRKWMRSTRVAEGLVELMTATYDGKGAQLTNTFEEVTGHPAQSFADWCRENIAAFQ